MISLYGLVGRELGYSFSRKFFTELFLRKGIEAEYWNFEIPDISLLSEIISSHPHLQGLNITIPYKESVIPLLSSLSPEAKEIGAVNVVKIIRDVNGEVTNLIGYNTDALGFKQALCSVINPKASRALVVGNGGAASAIKYVLKSLGIITLTAARHPRCGEILLPDLGEEDVSKSDIIVNTTPLGTYPDVDSAPPIPYDAIRKDSLCIDLVYNPPVTGFMRKCAEAGAAVKSGLDMLISQAQAAAEIWEIYGHGNKAGR